MITKTEMSDDDFVRLMVADGWVRNSRWDGYGERVYYWQHTNGFILDEGNPKHLETLNQHMQAGTTPPPF